LPNRSKSSYSDINHDFQAYRATRYEPTTQRDAEWLNILHKHTQDYAGRKVTEDLVERSLKEKLDDNAIKNTVRQALTAQTALENANIDVYCFARTIYLFGQAPSIKHIDLASSTSKKVKEVADVRNFMVIGSTISKTRALRDSSIKARIEKKFSEQKEIDLQHIRVAVSNAEVYLFGYATKKQAKEATYLARTVKGSSAIIQLFKYQY